MSDTVTVRDRIEEQLDAGTIHGFAVTARRGSTTYAVVSATKDRGHGEVVDLRTVVIDEDAEKVTVSDNGLWVPKDANTLDGLTQLVARTTSDVATGPLDDPLETGIDDVDVEAFLAEEIAPDTYDPDEEDDAGLSPAEGEPPEALHTLHDRFREAGIGVEERYIRLREGGKDPWHSHNRGDVEYVSTGYNYGVYAASDDQLVLIDVDDPEAFDAEIPDTFRVSSPHGGDDRAHHYLAVPDVEKVREAFGKWNLGPSWGDVRIANQYVVGPGSQLDGCDKGADCDGRCHAADGGVYRITNDAEIAEVSADWLIDVLSSDPSVSAPTRGETASTTETTEDTADDEEADDEADAGDVEQVTCFRCGDEVPKPEAAVFASDDSQTVYVHRGGCP